MIKPEDLAGLPGVRLDVISAVVSRQPTTVLQALRIRGVGRKTAYVLLGRGLLTDPDGVQGRGLTAEEFAAAPYKEPRS